MTNNKLLNNRYEIIEKLGSGGFAIVYKALDLSLDRTVAIKVLRSDIAQDPAFITRFQMEARSVAKLAHSNIVTVHDVGSDGSIHYFVMEMIDGHDLAHAIQSEGKLSTKQALSYAIQICDGIGFAHRLMLIHADIKPENILITKGGVAQVTDFGLAQAYTDTRSNTQVDEVWGTPYFLSPEQSRGERPTPASDVYSIGIVMFEMLTGQLPYYGESAYDIALAHIQEPIPRVRDLNLAVPNTVSNIIAKIMSKRPNDRYAHADQLGHVLKGIKRMLYEEPQEQSRKTTLPVVRQRPSTILSSSSRQTLAYQPKKNTQPKPDLLKPPPEYEIFVTCHQTNKALINDLTYILNRWQIIESVSTDKSLPFKNKWDAILRHIRNADVIIIGLSNSYLDSVANQRELAYIQALKKTTISIRVGELDNIRIPSKIAIKPIIDFSQINQENHDELFYRLRDIEPSKSLPNPLPKAPEAPESNNRIIEIDRSNWLKYFRNRNTD